MCLSVCVSRILCYYSFFINVAVVYILCLKVQLASAELLMLICSELIYIVRDSGKGFACYIADLLSRCKVQKVVLHCVLSSVYNMKSIANSQEGHSLKVCIEKPCTMLNFIVKYYVQFSI